MINLTILGFNVLQEKWYKVSSRNSIPVLTFMIPTCKQGGASEFLEWWNRLKSLSRIWQHFSCLLDEGIPKIWNKLNSHDGFLSYLLNSTANSAHLAAHFCPALVCPQKATVRIQFLRYFSFLPKWHFWTRAWNSKNFLTKSILLKHEIFAGVKWAELAMLFNR